MQLTKVFWSTCHSCRTNGLVLCDPLVVRDVELPDLQPFGVRMALAWILSILGNSDLEYFSRRLSSTVMPRPCKRQYRSASIVHSDSDWHFSPSDDDSSAQESDGSAPSTVVVPQKRAKQPKARRAPVPAPIADPTSPMINYSISILSFSEIKKSVSQRLPKSSSLQLRTNEPWDTMKAQFLVKISDALGQDASLDLTKYNIIVSIPRFIAAKPGQPLNSEADYTVLVNRISLGKLKDPIIANVTIVQLEHTDNKENEPAVKEKTKKLKKLDDRDLPSTVQKYTNIEKLQKHWKCNKQQANCLGTWCYINHEGNHVPLGHQRLDCWASAMVCPGAFLGNTTNRSHSLAGRLAQQLNGPPIITSSTRTPTSVPFSASVLKTRRSPTPPPRSTSASEGNSSTY